MCYVISQRAHPLEAVKLGKLSAEISESIRPKHKVHNGFNYSQALAVVPNAAEDNIEVKAMEWGFLPGYIYDRESAQKMRFGYKDPVKGFQTPITTLNAKGEELLLPRKIYRDAALNRRCLVPATGFFEHRHVFPTHKKTGLPLKTPKKYPYHISVIGQPYFYMASIYQPFTDKQTGEVVDTMAIITTDANPLMKAIHNSKERMPTVLNGELAEEWLFGDLSEERITQIATYQLPYQLMDACTIASNFKELEEPTEPYLYADLPAYELAL